MKKNTEFIVRTKTLAINLLPCPFCKSKAKIKQDVLYGYYRIKIVHNKECFLYDKGSNILDGFKFIDKKELIKKWNTRIGELT